METQNIVEQLKPVFEKVAEKIGTGAEFGWEVVMKQQYVDAALGFVWVLVGIGALVFAWWWGKKIEELHWDEFSYLPLSIWTIVWIVIALVNMEIFITRLINPKYYAIQFFMNLVK